MEITKILLGFDLFGYDNSTLGHTIETIGRDNLFIISNDQELYKKGIQRFPASIYDGDIITKYFNQIKHKQNINDHIVLLMPHFPFRTKEQINESIKAYEQSKANFLISMTSQGLDSEAIYITSKKHLDKEGKFISNPQESFIYMLDDISGLKARNPEHYKQLLKQKPTEIKYSIKKQRELAATYRDNMRDYDQEFLDGKEITDPVILRSSKDAPERINKLTQIPKGKKILDLGCSSGNVTIRYGRIVNKDSYILGVDIDQDLIDTANEYLRKEPQEVQNKINFVCQPVETLDEKLESFDTIAATEFFEHILHTKHTELMEYSLKFLKPNGNMIISVPNRFPAEYYNIQKRYRWDWSNHYTHFTAKSLEHLMGKYFKDVKLHPVYNESSNEGIFLIAEGRNKK